MRGWFATEDWWAVWLGLLIVALALPATAGVDLLGWAVTTNIWLNPAQAMAPFSRAYAHLPGIVSVDLTYVLLLALLGLGAWAQGFDLGRFVPAFTIIFFISYACWLAGNY